jgi:hypothetical protein
VAVLIKPVGLKKYLYSSLNIVRVIKLRKIRWAGQAGQVARMGEKRGAYWFWLGNRRERDHLEDPGVDGRIVLRWIFKRWDVEAWAGSNWFRIGTGGGHL